ncbi:GT4 family glycosyltransferase PelF [Psychrobacillus sp. FSL W7-1457]|uniref:GT4 family glycosyltransferase PelF n=1 Tax=unclassified Psychrobacillus TaxID=2636677 RepID=UPI00203B5E35|nr:GT4 family glycosyltransferase PelF [Psychrobacillus sp. MER TA 171]
MKICLIAEGSYPYVNGGVSSWIHSLVTEMPEHEFIIYAIGAETKQKGKYRYTLPANLLEVKEIFLDEYLYEEKNWGRRYKLTDEEKNNLVSLITGSKDIHWSELFDLLRSKKFENVGEFLSSKDYFDLIEFLAGETYSRVPFTELFWTVRSMILPLFLTIRHDVPEADVYHAVSTGYAGVVGTLAKHVHQKPLLLTEHGIYSREREEEIIKADWVKGYFKDLWINYFYTLSNSIYGASDQVITLFDRNKEIEVELGCPEEKIVIIPNGVEISSYSDLQAAEDEDILRIGAIVRLVPIKDIKTMIQSFGLIEKEISNVELFIMGPTDEDDMYYRECLQMVNTLGIKRIIFTGMVDVKEYVGKMDILLLTSISEGQPLAILEGLASKKPFVATNVGGCKELILGSKGDNYGQAGFIASVMNYEEIASYILQLCNDKKLRETMGSNGFNRVKNNYKRSSFITGYRELYLSVGGVAWQA